MFSLKRICFYLCIILLLLSMYRDLTDGVVINNKVNQGNPPQEVQMNQNMNQKLKAVKLKVQPGETLLTISEKINGPHTVVNIEQVIKDFILLNHKADPYHLKTNKYYYFPIYEDS